MLNVILCICTVQYVEHYVFKGRYKAGMVNMMEIGVIFEGLLTNTLQGEGLREL